MLPYSDGSLLVSDHLIMCLPVITEPLSVRFTVMIRHSFMPKLFRDCTLQRRDLNAGRGVAETAFTSNSYLS